MTIFQKRFLPSLQIFIASNDVRPLWKPAAAKVASIRSWNYQANKPLIDLPMAFTPSKDQKRREREQKKLDKRMAREDARAEKLEALQLAAEADIELTEEQIQAKIEADFEAELEAEAAAERESKIAC